ncbi:ATP-grasp domain-containing protein [Pontibacillus salicampi]|uniref:ATP-grasp domain-containing protein n=1 Tax=Pontibacillus salicampi TaxID=1449801 RepID=A0ABV6LLK9_9BACI
MNTIIFIGLNKSGSSRDAVRAAYDLGYHTIVFTRNERKIKQREQYPDVHQLFWVEELDQHTLTKEIIMLQQRGFVIKAISSFIDQHVHLASTLADTFCPDHPCCTDAIHIMENKQNTRVYFSEEPYTPNFILIDKQEDIASIHLDIWTDYPAMVKVSKSTGSKDALQAVNLEELTRNIQKLRNKYPEETIIVEEFIDGPQYLAEVLVFNGEIHLAAIIEQEITKGKRFIITGYGVLAECDADIERGIKRVAASIVQSLHMTNGTFHLELRHKPNGCWKLVEINPRISGGAMNRMIEAAFGINLVKETLKIQLGEAPDLTKTKEHFVFTQHICIARQGILERVLGKNKALQSEGVVDVYIKPRKGTTLFPPMSMGHRYAHVIAIGSTLEEATHRAKQAAKLIQFHLHTSDTLTAIY